MNRAIRVHAPGGPEVLQFEAHDPGEVPPGSALVRHTAVGLNYIDVYFREGGYAPPGYPFVPGLEAAGVVESVGEGVDEVAVGDRVAYAGGPVGAYAEARVIPAHRLVPIPDGVDDRTAAAMMLKGMTARYLLRRTYPVKAGDTVLFHAAAGGVGLIACQWARHLGATVIGTVSSDAKAELAHAHGCDHVLVHGRDDLVARTRELTGGEGVAVVYDSIGRDTFLASLDCLRPLGTMVLFGQSSGKPEPFDVSSLAPRGSLFLTRPTLMTYTAKREALLATAEDLFDVVRAGAVRIEIHQAWPLAEAAEAHRALEGRRTTGSTLLLP